MKAMQSARQRADAQMSFGTALPILHRSYRAAADKAVGHVGMSQATAWPLVMIGRLGNGVRPGVLADMLAIEGPSLVRQLDQLVEAGLVERREDPVDRRAKTLHLTLAGQRARTRIESALDGFRQELFDEVSSADLAACLRVFGALEARLERMARGAVVARS
jgi:MarR family transcriptional regulator, transcriptional regulator for hemolysin